MSSGDIKIRTRDCPLCGTCGAHEFFTQSKVHKPMGYFGETEEEYGQGPSSPQHYRVEIYETTISLNCRQCVSGLTSSYMSVNDGLSSIFRNDKSLIRRVDPAQFEDIISDRFEKAGFSVSRAGKTNTPDGGIDLIATHPSSGIAPVVVAVQVKHHRNNRKTGVEAVDRMMAWRNDIFQFGFIVTNTGFTRDAHWKAAKPNAIGFIRLRDGSDVSRWLDDHFSSLEEAREIPEQVQLTSGLIVPIAFPAEQVTIAMGNIRKPRLVSKDTILNWP